ncbi:putative membrane protein, partial [Yersinia pestis PY-05]
FREVCCYFCLSVAVIALNAFQWCVQIAVMLNSQLFLKI